MQRIGKKNEIAEEDLKKPSTYLPSIYTALFVDGRERGRDGEMGREKEREGEREGGGEREGKRVKEREGESKREGGEGGEGERKREGEKEGRKYRLSQQYVCLLNKIQVHSSPAVTSIHVQVPAASLLDLHLALRDKSPGTCDIYRQEREVSACALLAEQICIICTSAVLL